MVTATNLHEASSQWATRPDDQRFLSLEELRASVAERKAECWTATPQTNDLRARALEGNQIALDVFDPTKGERRLLEPTNWSFGQLSQFAGAPAGYLRKLPAELAAINLQYGFERNPLRDEGLVLAQSNGDDVLRSITSTSYGRIWDLDVVDAVMQANDDGLWKIPAASYASQNPKRASTLYASDRDIFLFLVDDQHPIELDDGRNYFRGFYTWNSEVGSATFGLCAFLYSYVCDNRIIWGATNVRELKIRHTGGAPDRFAYEGRQFLSQYAHEATHDVVSQIKAAREKAIPTGKDQSVEEWLKTRGFTKGQAKASVDAAVAEEGEARSVWDIINGVTAYARSIPHTDERVKLERQAGAMMKLVE